MENSIEINNLSKSFKDVKAVDDLSFKVKKGEFFAFLGVNGAGKSTTISIMCGQLAKDSGSVTVNGKNIEDGMNEIRKEIGVVFQSSLLDTPLTVRDNLEMRAALYDITGSRFEQRLNELAELLDFKDLLNRTYGKLSGGQKRKIDVARALFHHPSILILDEPTTGLHNADIHKLTEVLQKLVDNGNTVLVIEHNLGLLKVCDHIIDIGPEGGDNGGTIIATGTPEEIVKCEKSYTGQYLKKYL